ncbi:transcriptional repressor [Campylobacter sp. TTU-622]|uniref:Fur family transcriptional regulator n=1 Tax=unclassified Campylobacter TaxID=2593542 RepID=UPI001906906E|nr:MULTISPECIES: Fur family transcriptional regulator [unclassified Campylobacter]MBK1972093.1 transcriptional repressor [Campylobacter sp. TTU_617]MBK1973290.1 transcriptional repressor [Campylobacter sp. TTU-622]MBK1991792.1 transcriptional repressor [Campylobacter sp. 2018MI34]
MLVENIEYDVLLESFKKILRKGGLKYTKQREILLKTLYNSDTHYTPESLYMEIKQIEPNLNIGIATVYRTLNLLEDAQMVTSISFGSAGKKYELANKPHHDHMICKNCGKIIEFENSIIEEQQSVIAQKYNFKLTGHLMQLYGICNECNIKAKTRI